MVVGKPSTGRASSSKFPTRSCLATFSVWAALRGGRRDSVVMPALVVSRRPMLNGTPAVTARPTSTAPNVPTSATSASKASYTLRISTDINAHTYKKRPLRSPSSAACLGAITPASLGAIIFCVITANSTLLSLRLHSIRVEQELEILPSCARANTSPVCAEGPQTHVS